MSLPPGVRLLRADNPSPMTLQGTNTWLVEAAGGWLVVDPGPDLGGHRAAILAQGPITRIVLTHRHPDHTDGVAALVEATGAPVDAADPDWVRGGVRLHDGERVGGAPAGGLRVLATPGHTSDSICLQGPGFVLTGDTILGAGTTVVAHPDGRLADYLASLDRLAALDGDLVGLCGHGPDRPSVAATAREYRAHREQRLEQVQAVLRQRPTATAEQVVQTVYADVDQALWGAAEWSVRAQLEYLRG